MELCRVELCAGNVKLLCLLIPVSQSFLKTWSSTRSTWGTKAAFLNLSRPHLPSWLITGIHTQKWARETSACAARLCTSLLLFFLLVILLVLNDEKTTLGDVTNPYPLWLTGWLRLWLWFCTAELSRFLWAFFASRAWHSGKPDPFAFRHLSSSHLVNSALNLRTEHWHLSLYPEAMTPVHQLPKATRTQAVTRNEDHSSQN